MICVEDRTLTPEQQEFAHAHYGLLLKFMGTHGLTDEEYGPIAERYVKTVKKYLETESLHQYQFSTILWYRLRSELYTQRKKTQKGARNISLDDYAEFFGTPDDHGAALLWEEISQQITMQQLELLRLRAIGFSPQEIANMKNCSRNAIHCRFKRIRKKLKTAGII